MQLEQTSHIDGELIGRLEIGAVTAAEEAFHKESSAEDEELGRGFFLVGYSVLSYYLDNLNISSLMDHKGKTLKAEVIATFLPREVVDSLYMTMQKCGLEVRENHHKAKSENTKQPQCPKEKADAIVEALRHFQMI